MGESESAQAEISVQNGDSPEKSGAGEQNSAEASEKNRSTASESQSSKSNSKSSSPSSSLSDETISLDTSESTASNESTSNSLAAQQPSAVSNEPSERLSESSQDSSTRIEGQHDQLESSRQSPGPVVPAQHREIEVSSKKYHPQTRSRSDGSDVRWYFCKTTLQHDEPAASVPTTAFVGRGEYFRFSKGDSDALEAAFLEREEELVGGWWREYAESREGPSSGTSSYYMSRGDDFESTRRSHLSAWDEEGNVGVVVKGGLYEVDLASRRCLPVYWRGDHRRVLRGHWFARKGGLDWLPVREDLSEQLEIAYERRIWRRRRFQPSGLYAARFNLHGGTQGLHALFTGEDDTWEAFLGVDKTGLSLVLGFKAGAVKLRRGFALPESATPTQDEIRQHREEQMDDYASKVPVRHVVFMVHGIGQRLEKASLIDDVSAFRHTVDMLADEHLTKYQSNSQRILFIPCQWRRGLKLGGESIVEDCTLEGVRTLRTMLSATVHDVLYYMSPVYCQDIIDSVTVSLNMLYGKFLKRNPNYDGKVSIYGHSLGSILSYDILCHQTDESATSTAPITEVQPQLLEKTLREQQEKSGLRHESGDVEGEDFNASKKGSKGGSTSEEDPEGDPTRDDYLEEKTSCEQNKAKEPTDYDSSQDRASEVEALKAEVRHMRERFSMLADQSKEKSGTTSESEDSEHETSNGAVGEIVENKDNVASGGSKGKGELDGRFPSKKHFTPYISYTKLDFKVDTFYAVGSPLGVFLSLRNIRIGEGFGQEYWQDDSAEEEMPAVRQMINIFHPYDPVAYRIEPLVCKELVNVRPIFVPYHKGGKRFHISVQEFQEHLSARGKAFAKSLRSYGRKVFNSLVPASQVIVSEEDTDVKEKTYGELMLERLTGSPDGRLDYQLQDSTFEHQYISVLSSHTAYWHDFDTALFILRHLYRDISPEPPPPPRDDSESGEDSQDIPEDSPLKRTTSGFRSLQPDIDEMSLTFLPKDVLTTVFNNAKRVKPDWLD